MFTGIIEEVGRISAWDRGASPPRLTIAATCVTEDLAVGKSIAINGACLTAVDVSATQFTVEVSQETISRTTLSSLAVSGPVNLERALRADGRLDGHFVLGHVDGVGTVLEIIPQEGGHLMKFGVPPGAGQYLVPKGSVAVDGVSLTVAEVWQDEFSVAIIPHTWENTLFSLLNPGDSVNIESDILGKFVEALLKQSIPAEEPVTVEFLKRHGFA